MFEQFGIWPVAGGLYDQDMDFLNELSLARMARDDHSLFSTDSKDNPDLKKQQTKRQVALMKWKDGIKRST